MMMRTKKWIVRWSSIALGLVLLVGVVGERFPYKRVDNAMCPVTGSMRREITWFGYFSHEERTVSALELWLRRREPSFQPQWQHISRQTYYVLSGACGTAGSPEIYLLRPMMDGIVEKFSDERIADLVAILRHGSRDEQSQAIHKIADDYFEVK